MAGLRVRGVGLTDLAYLGVIVAAHYEVHVETDVKTAMVLFGGFILLVSWAETRRLIGNMPTLWRYWGIAFVLTLLMLGVWFGMMIQPGEQLALYFLLMAGFFFVQATRDTILLGLSAKEIFFAGYIQQVGAFLILGVVAHEIEWLDVALVMIAFLIYIVRKLYSWIGGLLGYLYHN